MTYKQRSPCAEREQKGRNRNREKYLSALITSATLKEAAEKAGITPRGLRKAMKDPSFEREYSDLKGEILDDAARQLRGHFRLAIETLAGILADGKPVDRLPIREPGTVCMAEVVMGRREEEQ